MKPVSSHPHRSRRQRWIVPAALICLGLLPGATGCKLIKSTASVPGRTVSALFPGGKSTQPDPADLQQGLMSFADAYAAMTIVSVDELVEVPGSPLTRKTALLFKISTVGGVITIATGENPYASLLDMVSLTTLSRMVLEDHWLPSTNGVIFEPWLKRMQGLETNIWSIADQVLSKDQQEELRRSIQAHYGTLTDLNDLFLVHPHDLLVPRTLVRKQDPQSVFSLAALNPMAGLDPAVREITETRLFAARAMFTIQRMPWLVRWQAELLVLDATTQPQVAQALKDATSLSESVDRASQAAESISQTAAVLPARIAAERKAIMEALEAQEGQLNTVFHSGTEFSDSLGITITNFDALMKRFGVGVPDTKTAPPDPNARPFDVLDYAKTAEQVTAMAKQLNLAINELNTTATALARRSGPMVAGLG